MDPRKVHLKDLMKKLDPKVLNLIGYRIPNQKMSSIQPLEVVGILPPSMGDAIMMYSEITMQTGSDFDIDKTYIIRNIEDRISLFLFEKLMSCLYKTANNMKNIKYANLNAFKPLKSA